MAVDVRASLGLPAKATDAEVEAALASIRAELREARGAPDGWVRAAEDESVAVFDSYGSTKITAPKGFENQDVIAVSTIEEEDGRVRTSVRVRKETNSGSKKR